VSHSSAVVAAARVTPGPGWLFIFIGLGIWGTEFAWAHHLNQRLKRLVLRIWHWFKERHAERKARKTEARRQA